MPRGGKRAGAGRPKRFWFPIRKDGTVVGFLGLHMWGAEEEENSIDCQSGIEFMSINAGDGFNGEPWTYTDDELRKYRPYIDPTDWKSLMDLMEAFPD